ncbi:MAG: 4-(cytidine 5'-diphospho)-2-C-methyl-D-erythritol kinase [Lachnospiraceae bacterium]
MDNRTVRLIAYGKINIGLDVIGRRNDGYHSVRMIMQTVDICDYVTVAKKRSGITVGCDDPLVPGLEDNIAWKAAKLITDKYGLREGVNIFIEKNIPVAAGMAGGSTDAAAVITGMNRLFGLNMSREEQDEIAMKIGADVPFCLRRGTYLAEGLGEKLTALKDMPEAGILVVTPPFEISTKEVYAALDSIDNPERPDIDGMCEAIGRNSLTLIAERMGNILEQVTGRMHPIIGEIKREMINAGAMVSMMTGSGPTIFGLFESNETAAEAVSRFSDESRWGKSFTTQFVKDK